MRAGAVERWRILNGSVDGRGYKRFMVLEGEFVTDDSFLKRVDPDTGDLEAVTPDDVITGKQQLYQLAMDGVTLVSPDGNYRIKDLAEQNPNAVQNMPTEEASPQAALAAFEACYKDEQSVIDCYVRPNEVYLAPANRTDLFFRAPTDSEDKIFTVLAKAVVVHGDNYQNGLQKQAATEDGTVPKPPGDIIIAYIAVSGEASSASPDILNLLDGLEAPDYLQPIEPSELVVSDVEVDGREDVETGQYRTRSLAYSGWGAADFPLIYADPDFVDEHPELEDLVYAPAEDDQFYLLAPNIRTMAINAQFDLSDDKSPPIARKFDPMDPDRAQMLVDSAEEWVVYNNSISLWSDITEETPGVNNGAKTGYPILRATGQAEYATNPNFRLQTKTVDHPFHIHINPFYVLRIDVPDENGNLINILDEPRWQDVVWLPRNGGRVVFRSRFF